MNPYPNLYLVGAPKAGTTSIYEYLKRHPNIFVPAKKELHFFSSTDLDTCTAGPGDAYALSPIVRSSNEYLSYYRDAYNSSAIVVDVSPSYLYYSQSADRILTQRPDAKFAVILRDPVERAYSQYLHLRRAGRETLTFEDALDAEPDRVADGWAAMWRYVDANVYSRPLEHLLSVGGAENVLVLHSEHLRRDHNGTLGAIYDFCGLERIDADRSVVRNVGGISRSALVARMLNRPNRVKAVAKRIIPQGLRTSLALKAVELNTAPTPEEMKPDTRRRLQATFADEASRLQDMLGYSPPWSWIEER